MSNLEVKVATTEAEREAIYRFRYDIYVQELGKFANVADHERRILRDAADETGWLYYADDGGKVVGTLRVNMGEDGPFPPDLAAPYGLERFDPVVSRDKMAIASRMMVHPDYRGGPLAIQLSFEGAMRQVAHKTELTFCDCEPHLLNFYLKLGYRTYGPAYCGLTTLLVPLVLVAGDHAYLERLGSPFASLYPPDHYTNEISSKVLPLLEAARPVVSANRTEAHEYLGEVFGLLTNLRERRDIFVGLSEAEIAAVLSSSHVLDFDQGGYLIRQGQAARTVFVVLDGAFEVVDGGRVVAMASAGDVVGEIAFLLESRRTGDVRVASPTARVLSLSEKTMRKLIDESPRAAALLLLNLSKALALKLLDLRARLPDRPARLAAAE